MLSNPLWKTLGHTTMTATSPDVPRTVSRPRPAQTATRKPRRRRALKRTITSRNPLLTP
jgi:hypothetical protein